MNEFWRTVRGVQFLEGTFPRLVEQLETIASKLPDCGYADTRRERIATVAMAGIIADPTELERETEMCPDCKGTKQCGRCEGVGKIELSCAQSVAIKAVRYADELIAELGRKKV